ncbi:carboxypeptidase D [Malassezia cuniculi]|uniref:Carboxypeptidase D n=1 Tax=Malassezia cuniculi TaxID=948313 RepID=A0AAF0ER23_9BASI|nr:carboxypeptidase D [Malassezia cuniculi]
MASTCTASSVYNISELRSRLGSNGTEKFEIGTRLPNVSFEIPPSWGGYLPVSNKTKDREIYFWMFPATGDVGHDDLVIWFNGGPGCSSLSGVMVEEGPLKIDGKTHVAQKNPYSWTNLTNMLWIDQPVGTGFSRGEAKNMSMVEVAQEFNGFLVSLYSTFPKLRGKKLWLAGESFAGKFIPFIADHIYTHKEENEKAGINLQGIGMNDAFFMDNTIGKELPAVQFAQENAKLMKLNQSDVDSLVKLGKEIGIDDYVEKYLTYPPAGPLPVPSAFNQSKSVYSAMKKMAKKANPCFSPFYIINSAPCPLDGMGLDPVSEVGHTNNYFNNNPTSKQIIHADNVSYVECSHKHPFKIMKNSKTEFPLNTVLPSVIEKSKRTVIQHGAYDYVMLPNGSALAIQNMTWGGLQGFQKQPSSTLMVDGKNAGTYHIERNLTFVMVDKASHMIPVYKPKAGYKLLQYMLGQISEDKLSN